MTNSERQNPNKYITCITIKTQYTYCGFPQLLGMDAKTLKNENSHFKLKFVLILHVPIIFKKNSLIDKEYWINLFEHLSDYVMCLGI